MRRYVKPGVMVLCIGLTVLTACQGAPARPEAAPTALPGIGAVAETPSADDISFGQATLFAGLDPLTQDQYLEPVDPATGRPIEGFAPIVVGNSYDCRITPDGRTMILIAYPEERARPIVRFIAVQAWAEVGSGVELKTRGFASAAAMSADGSRLALATTDNADRDIWLIDVPAHELLASVETPLYITAMAFTGKGNDVMVYGNPENFNTGITDGPPVAEFRSARDLALLWSRPLDGVQDGFVPNANFKGQAHEPGTGSTYRPAAVFDAAQDTMYVLHADSDKLTRVEFESRRVLTQEIRPQASLLERLLSLGAGAAQAKALDGVTREALLSPDGATIYVTGVENDMTMNSRGEWQFDSKSLPLRGIDARSGVERFRSEAGGFQVQYEAELGSLYVISSAAGSGVSTSFEISATDGAVLNAAQGEELRVGHRMDGSALLLGAKFSGDARTTLSAWTLEGVPLGEWRTSQFGNWVIVP